MTCEHQLKLILQPTYILPLTSACLLNLPLMAILTVSLSQVRPPSSHSRNMETVGPHWSFFILNPPIMFLVAQVGERKIIFFLPILALLVGVP